GAGAHVDEAAVRPPDERVTGAELARPADDLAELVDSVRTGEGAERAELGQRAVPPDPAHLAIPVNRAADDPALVVQVPGLGVRPVVGLGDDGGRAVGAPHDGVAGPVSVRPTRPRRVAD